MKAADFLVIK